jgi:lactoylglutathione lyase
MTGTGRRLLHHTMVRVFDLDKSVDFYTNLLGMKELRRNSNEGGRYTVCFLGYGTEEQGESAIELTYNWDQAEPYDLGNAFGHFAIAVNDVYEVCDKLDKAGAKIPRPAGPLAHTGPDGPVIAFVEDPDGYKIELVSRPEL